MDRYCELVLSFLKANMMPLAPNEEGKAGFIGSLLGDSEILDQDLQPPDGRSRVPAQPCLAQSKANLLEGYQSLLP